MLIRPYREADEAAVIALCNECELTRPWNDPRKDIARKSRVQPEWFLVGTWENEIIASVMAGYEGHRGWVNYLAVARAHRGRGHATALMRHPAAVSIGPCAVEPASDSPHALAWLTASVRCPSTA